MFMPKPLLDKVNAFLSVYSLAPEESEDANVEALRDLDEVRARFNKA